MFKIRLDSYSHEDQKKILEFQHIDSKIVEPQKFLAIVQHSLENVAKRKAQNRSCIDVNLMDDKDREMFMDEMIIHGFVPKDDQSFTLIIPDVMVYTQNNFGSHQIGSFDEITKKSLEKAFSEMRMKIDETTARLLGNQKLNG